MDIKLILTDMDGTAVDYPNEPFRSSWDAIGDSLGEERRKEWYRVRDHYIGKKDQYLEWVKAQLRLIKHIPREGLLRSVLPIPYFADALSFFPSLNGTYVTGMVTSGFPLVVERASKDLHLDFCLYEDLCLENPDSITSIRNQWEKDIWLEEFLARSYPGIRLEDHVCYIGDHDIDISLFKRVALPLTINPKSKAVRKHAMEIKTFSEILDII